MTEDLERTVRMPSAIDWFINRTNAGDIDSILDVLATGAVVHHDGHALDWYALDDFLASPWYLGGYINLTPVATAVDEAGEWKVTVTISGRSDALEAARGSVFAFRFVLRGDKIASIRIERVPDATES